MCTAFHSDYLTGDCYTTIAKYLNNVQRLKNPALQQNDQLHLTDVLHPQQTFPDVVEDMG